MELALNLGFDALSVWLLVQLVRNPRAFLGVVLDGIAVLISWL